MCIDIMAQDATVFAEGMTDAKLDALFSEAGAAIGSAAANLWGVHLPYRTYDISATDETTRTTAVAKLKAVITSVMKHMSPKHFVIHPSTGTILTTGKRLRGTQGPEPEIAQGITDPHRGLQFDVRPAHDSLRGKLSPKRRLRCRNDARPAQRRGAGAGARLPRYGPRPDSAERVVYQSDQKRDAVAILRKLGTRLGTLHIQQNPGANGQSGTLDKHLQPYDGGLIDWGEFYYELLKNNRYRGCFLYEVSFTDTYDGTTATIESAKANYTGLVYPAFTHRLNHQ